MVHDISISVAPGEGGVDRRAERVRQEHAAQSIVGLVQVYSGQVLIGNRDVTGWRSENVARIGVGCVPQIDDVFAPLTVREPGDGRLCSRRARWPGASSTCCRCSLSSAGWSGRRAGKLSGGERKMPAMDRALMLQPVLVVLDEPTANLAPKIAATVLQEHFRQLAGTGASVLVVEQRARAGLEISDRTYGLGGGQLRMEGTPAELSNSSEFVESFLGGGPREP